MINASYLLVEKFEDCCRFYNLPVLTLRYDVVTRRGSAFTMLERAVFLRKAIERFVDLEDLDHLRLSKKEWDQCELLLTILLPFKKTSDRLQQTKRPSIDAVFWSYETLFNEIDELNTIFNTPINKQRSWIQELACAVKKMMAKLRKYYNKTERPYVYSDGQILEPRGKLILFDQDSWDPGDADKYSRLCRERYLRYYASQDKNGSTVDNNVDARKAHPLKRKIAEITGEDDDDDDDDDYRLMQRRRAEQGCGNEYDRYVKAPVSIMPNEDTLDWWRRQAPFYPNLSLMVRDTLSVPATGAGVEREFSKSGKVATWARSRLNTGTISEIMMFKNFLARKGDELRNWEDSDLGIAEEHIVEIEVPKKWRRQWWLDKRNRLR